MSTCKIRNVGNIETINQVINSGQAKISDFKFFVGYSGWGEGQLEFEIEQKAWWLAKPTVNLVFLENIEEIWPTAVRNLGPDFAYLADSPEDFLWN